MKSKVSRIVVFGAVLALIGALVIGSAALAQGSDGAYQARTQAAAGDTTQAQERNQAGTQDQTQTRERDGIQTQDRDRLCGDCASDGSQVRAGEGEQGGNTYGPGEGEGPIGGGQFGPGPFGTCVDLNENGICDCKE